MADPVTEAGPPPGGPPKPGGKIAGFPRRNVLVFVGALGAAVAYFWWKNRQSSSASTDAGATADTTGTDDSADLSALETELQDLQAAAGAGAAGGGGTTGTTGDGGGGDGTTGGTPPPPVHKPTPTRYQQITVGGPNGTRDLYQIAKAYGLTEAQLIQLNPQLKKYEGTKKPIPKRQKITV